jgi:2-oxoglutarate ferredoxin oxidoreductase subunit beta
MSDSTLIMNPEKSKISKTAIVQTQPGMQIDKKPLPKKINIRPSNWCPGCARFTCSSVFMKVLEKRQTAAGNIVTISGIGCSSRFPYFVQTHGAHFIHGRAIPFATGVSFIATRFASVVFIGDGDGFSIGGNHFIHAARPKCKNDSCCYGITRSTD